MTDVQFKRRIPTGEVLRFAVERVHTGRTSVRYRVRVHGLVVTTDPQAVLCETDVTFVNVGVDGHKAPIPDSPL